MFDLSKRECKHPVFSNICALGFNLRVIRSNLGNLLKEIGLSYRQKLLRIQNSYTNADSTARPVLTLEAKYSMMTRLMVVVASDKNIVSI